MSTQNNVDLLYVKPVQDKNYVRLNKNLNPIYRMGRWVHKSGYYRLFRPRTAMIQKFWGMLIGRLFLERPRTKKLAKIGLPVLIPGLKPSSYEKLIHRYFAYLAELMVDMIFQVPTINPDTWQKSISISGREHLDAALAQKHGVLMPTLHIGQFFHLMAYLAFVKKEDGTKRYEYVVLGTPENVSLFSIMASKHKNVYAIITRDYNDVKEKILRHLRKNRIIILFHDFSKAYHLHTPFNISAVDFMKPTPQSIISFQRETQAAIIPAVVISKGILCRSELRFLDPAPINAQLSKLDPKNERVFHGELSMAINGILHPYLHQNAYLWEELASFGGWVRLQHIKVPKDTTWQQLINLTHEKMHGLLTNSYFPSRDDEKLHSLLDRTHQQLLAQIKSPTAIFRNNVVRIKYFANSVEKEIANIYMVLAKELIKIHEDTAAEIIKNVLSTLEKLK